MALKNFRPLTPTLRFKSLPGFDEITKWRPAKRLVAPKKKTGGRNNFGRLTSRHIGGGHKQKYRKVDFKRRKRGVNAEVIGIEYDPNRSARIALIKYADAELSYILAPDGLRVGSTVAAGEDAATSPPIRRGCRAVRTRCRSPLKLERCSSSSQTSRRVAGRTSRPDGRSFSGIPTVPRETRRP